MEDIAGPGSDFDPWRSRALHLKLTLYSLVVCALLAATAPLKALVISEIYYHPPEPDGTTLEFVELHNPADQDVLLGGWRFIRGIEFTFPEGAKISAGGYVVVCRNVAAFKERFSLDRPEVFGDFEGALDNGGEEITLVDAFNTIADSVRYDDDRPWPEEADSDGDALQRLCSDPDSYSSDVANWGAARPNPLTGVARGDCPPPSSLDPAVVISEIFYHPPFERRGRSLGDDGEALEYVELRNLNAVNINIGGWKFTDGIQFTFPVNTVLPPNGHLVVCRNEVAVINRFQITNTIGDFEGELLNSGERLTLEDAAGDIVDSVFYGDSRDWSYAADQEGGSLERIVLNLPGDDPSNWRSSRVPRNTFLHQEVVGKPGPLSFPRMVISLEGKGEAIVDDVMLVDSTDPGTNLLEHGQFEETDLPSWNTSGTAGLSEWSPSGGIGGSGGLLLKSTGPCFTDGCRAFNGVWQVVKGIRPDREYLISLEVKSISGNFQFRAGFHEGTEVNAIFGTPGKPNSVADSEKPPFITGVRRYPQAPTSDDPTWITAKVRSQGEPTVRLLLERPQAEVTEFLLKDDGMFLDGEAGDGVFGVELPAFPSGTQVRFRLVAELDGRRRHFPNAIDADEPLSSEVYGYYVNDTRPDSPFPVYHILLDGVDGSDRQAVNSHLNCQDLKPGSFAYRGDLYPDLGVRFRGNTACVIDKRNFKLKFNRDRRFRGLKKLNLNGLWTDKALVREHLAWDFMKQLGAPYCETYYVRLHVSGSYFGLFLYLEHPDERFLERNGLNDEGSLYKSRQPRNIAGNPVGIELRTAGKYPEGWEEETNAGADFSDIEAFIGDMHTLGNPDLDDDSVTFWQDRSDEEMIISFMVGNIVLNNIDSSVKNHFLYHDVDSGRWGLINWDVDLVFGKFFNPDAVDASAGRQVGTLNDYLLSTQDPPWDLDPWTMTAVVEENMRYNWLLDFFFRSGEDNDYYRRAYLIRMWNILMEKYRNEVYDPILDELRDRIADEEAEDFQLWGRYPSNVEGYPQDMASNIELIKEQLALHRDFLIDFIEEKHAEIPNSARAKIVELMYAPEEGDHDLEFLKLLNTTGRTIDVSGWTIDGISYAFPPATLLGVDEEVVVARSPSRFERRYPNHDNDRVFGPYLGRLSNEGEELRVRDSGPGFPATVDVLRYEVTGAWPEVKAGYSIQLRNVTPDVDNDFGYNWILSTQAGGSPSVLPFIRGDVNGDTIVDISDVVGFLVFVLLGGEGPDCLDSADMDDTGVLDITDPIFLLSHLFLGLEPPPPPFPEPGADPTPDGLACP